MTIDYTKLLAKLDPQPGGEDVARMRTGVVDAVNSDGTVDLGISGIVIPDVARLAGSIVAVGMVVNVISYRGSLLVIGPTSQGDEDLTGYMVTGTYIGVATNDLVLTTSVASITGCTFNFTTLRANAILMVDLVVDFDATNTTAQVGTAYIRLDSTDISSSQATFGHLGNANGRGTQPQNYRVPVAPPGAHTMTARALTTAASPNNGITAKAGHSTIRGTLYEVA